MKILIEIFYYLISLLFIIINIKRHRISPLLIFIMSQTFMFYGIVDLIDINIKADRVHMIIMLVSLIVLIYGDFVFGRIFKLKNRELIIENNKLNNINKKFYVFKIIFLSIFSIVICSLFFISLGYNVFLVGIKNIINKSLTTQDIVEYRLNAYSSGVYRGAGYVYQFRNIILPLITATIYYLSEVYNSRTLKIYSILTAPLVVIFSLGTGQRGGFVMLFLMIVLSIYFIKNLSIKKVVKYAIIFFILFSILSTSLGRTSITYDSNLLTILKSNFDSLIKRIINDNQSTAVIGFRYIYNNRIHYGMDWFHMLRDVLPGRNNYISLATKIFALAYGGSTRGTAPPSIWGSVWYNWGPIGILIVPLIISFFYAYIYYLFISKKNTVFRIVCFSGIFVILGFWIADGPMILVNTGLITILIMYYLIERFNFRQKKNKQ